MLGCWATVYYNAEGIDIPHKNYVSHYVQRMTEEKQGKLRVDQEWRPVVPIGLPNVEVPDKRVITMTRAQDVQLDGLPSHMQSAIMAALTRQNQTGNHTGRNHPISVPTASGEPVRG